MSKTVATILAILGVILVLMFSWLIWQRLRPSADAGLPTAVPTAALPPAASEDAWQRIQTNGTMIVGSSIDYPPFASYDSNFQPIGLDIAIIQEIGRRLGLAVEIRDYAFDGLGNALNTGQIDVAIAAITVTDSRATVVDFSTPYFASEDALIAAATSSINSVDSVEQVSALRVGVERGTVYEKWLQTNLVDTGQMPQENLLVYQSAEHAVSDLQQGRVELVAFDLQPAQVAASQGGVKIVAQGLNQQQFAIAVNKGQAEWLNQINAMLTQMQNDGTLTNLIAQYTNIEPSQVVPLPTPDSALPTATPAAAASATPQPCIDDMSFVADLNLNDNNMQDPPELPPGWPFVKGWRIRNTGTCVWDSAYSLVYVSGNTPAARMGGQPTAVQGSVGPNQDYDIFVNLVTPLQPGVYQGFWQMINNQNRPFGARIWVGIEVIGAATATPQPTATPSANVSFTADRTAIAQGECVAFTWNVVGASSVHFYEQGEAWQSNQVPASGSMAKCPPTTSTYDLRVIWPDNSVQDSSITITVQPVSGRPNITRFTLNPANQINAGECTVVQWAVAGDVQNIQIFRGNTSLWPQAPLASQLQDCPTTLGTVTYRIVATGSGGSSEAQESLNVVRPPIQPPTATPIPPVADPVIQSFTVNPAQVVSGGCFQISWRVGGGANRVQLLRNNTLIQDFASFDGSAQDCVQNVGDYTYTLNALNSAGVSAQSEQRVSVIADTTNPPALTTQWNLTSLFNGAAMASPIGGAQVWIAFNQNGTFSGSSGCNNYNGTFTSSGNAVQMSETIASTGNNCTQPAGIMEQEAQYFNLLRAVRSYVLNGRDLQMMDGNGRLILQYTAR